MSIVPTSICAYKTASKKTTIKLKYKIATLKQLNR